MADARRAVPAEMQVAALLKAAREAAVARDTQDAPRLPQPVAADATFGPAPSDTDWHREQILVAVPGSTAGSRRTGDQAAMRMALIAAGLAPPRPAQREALAAAALAALQATGPRRTFPLDFLSDDGRLNGFARRVQGIEPDAEPTAAEKIAQLEALIERMQAA